MRCVEEASFAIKEGSELHHLAFDRGGLLRGHQVTDDGDLLSNRLFEVARGHRRRQRIAQQAERIAEWKAEEFDLVECIVDRVVVEVRQGEGLRFDPEQFRHDAGTFFRAEQGGNIPQQLLLPLAGKAERADTDQNAQLLDRNGDTVYEIVEAQEGTVGGALGE